MKIIIFGKGERALACIKALKEARFIPQAILAQGNDINLISFLKKHNIPLLNSSEKVFQIKPDLIILIGYTKIIKEPLISFPKFGTINLHGGKLPDYRGASVLNWQIINGEVEGGVSIIYVDDGIDTGDIIAEERFSISSKDTIRDVVNKTLKIFPQLLVKTVQEIKQGTVLRKKQRANQGAYYHKRTEKDGEIFWKDNTAQQVYNLIRALTKPYPGAYAFIDGVRIKIWKAEIPNIVFRGLSGRVVRKYQNGIIVIAQDRGLLITECEADNMGAQDTFRFLSSRVGHSFHSSLLINR